MKKLGIGAAGVALILSAAEAAVAQNEAESEPARIASPPESGNPLPKSDDEWRFSIAFPMLWAPDVDGKIRGGDPIDFHVGFNDILDELSFGIMFELYANRGPFGLAFRTNYMQVEDESAQSGLIDTRIHTKLDLGVSDLLASFRVHDKVRLVTGVRQVEDKLTLDVFGQIGSIEILNEHVTVSDEELVDVLLGLNFNHWFSDRWAVMLNADFGVSGDNDRDRSIEFRGLYRISDLNNFWFGYRYLAIGKDISRDGTRYKIDMTQTGPTVGWAFTF